MQHIVEESTFALVHPKERGILNTLGHCFRIRISLSTTLLRCKKMEQNQVGALLASWCCYQSHGVGTVFQIRHENMRFKSGRI